MCSFMGNICGSSCRWFVLVYTPSDYSEHGVLYYMFVSDANGEHMVETYSRTSPIMVVYVASIISFYFPRLFM